MASRLKPSNSRVRTAAEGGLIVLEGDARGQADGFCPVQGSMRMRCSERDRAGLSASGWRATGERRLHVLPWAANELDERCLVA